MPGYMQTADLHVIDHWAYLGTARTEEELAELRFRESSAAFDVDVYRILVRGSRTRRVSEYHCLSGGVQCRA